MDGVSLEHKAASPHTNMELYVCKEQADTKNKLVLQKDLVKHELTETFGIVKSEADVQVKFEIEEIVKDETDTVYGNISSDALHNIGVDQKLSPIKVETMDEEIAQGIVKAEPINYNVSSDSGSFLDQYDVTQNEAGKKVFKCKLCIAYQTPYKRYMKSHLMHHSENKKFKCELCDYKTALKCNLLKHMTRHRIKKSLQCNKCDFNTNRETSLKMHQKTHLEEKPYNCKYCDFGCISNFHLLEHHRKHEETLYLCDMCGHQTHMKCNFLAHKKSHSKNQERKTFKCNSCPYYSTSKSELRKHLQWQHSGEKRYRCDQCSFSDKDISLLVTHMKTHLK